MKSLNVLGQKVKVIYADLSSEAICGKYSYDQKTMYIEKTLSKEQKNITLFHELFHAVIDRAGLLNTAISSDAQEIICDQFAKVLVENFKVIKK